MKKSVEPAPVPAFGLYGEGEQWPIPDLLHCETIAHRSQQYNWEIKPHRHHAATQLLYLATGRASARLDDADEVLVAPCLVVAPELCIHAFRFNQPLVGQRVSGYVITMAAALIQQLWAAPGSYFADLREPAVLPLTDAPALATTLVEQLAHEYAHPQTGREAMVLALASALLLAVARLGSAVGRAAPHRRDRKAEHFASFTALVERHYRSHKPLPDYARELGITTTFLNEVCRKCSGHSALQIIHRRLLLEARRNLVYTAMSVSAVADQLGFADPAYFTRFFTRGSGQSPGAFRQRFRQLPPYG
ncbi:MAG: helix-turn-helix domain-containing protein [Pseudomonadales bacterium]|nr:helix-turn-helix domain-containing protein [Halioglobus sp.]MCP5190658.1 helix-turn-helix domain-containing protein [Pseudomonadales bacterium]